MTIVEMAVFIISDSDELEDGWLVGLRKSTNLDDEACSKIFQMVSDTSLDFSLSVWMAWEYRLCRYAQAEEARPERAAGRLARNAHRDTES